MEYAKQIWVDEQTPVDAEHLNHMEDGIEGNNKRIVELAEEIELIKDELGEVGGVTATLVNQLGEIGTFSDPAQWATGSGTLTIENNTAIFNVTQLFTGIRPSQIPSFTLVKNHVLYYWAMIKTMEEGVMLSFNSYAPVTAPKNGEYALVSNWVVNNNDRSQPITITDNGSTYGGEISVQKIGYIDLTACCGAGNEPDKETMDALLIANNYWFAKKEISIGTAAGSLRDVVEKTDDTVNEKLMHNLHERNALIFGDSITETNYYTDEGNLINFTTNWPTYAMPYLGVANWYNYAKSGSTYHDVSTSSDYQTFAKQFEAAKEDGIEPDIIVVSLGTNDYQHDNTDTYDEAMAVETLDALDRTKLNQAIRYCYWALTEQYPNATIYAATPIQRPDVQVFTSLRESLIKMAQTYNVIVIDAGMECGICRQFETWGEAGRYLQDGLHPNEAGRRKMGAYYAQKILSTYNAIE